MNAGGVVALAHSGALRSEGYDVDAPMPRAFEIGAGTLGPTS